MSTASENALSDMQTEVYITNFLGISQSRQGDNQN
jgi:hypothetical protein